MSESRTSLLCPPSQLHRTLCAKKKGVHPHTELKKLNVFKKKMLSLTFHKRRCVEPNADSDGAAVQAEVVTPQQPGLVATVTCTTLPRVSLAASPSPSVAFPPALTHTHNSTETPYPCTTYPQLKKKRKNHDEADELQMRVCVVLSGAGL